MGTKTFTLSFDAGRVAPYQIKERRGKFHGLLWLNMFGLKWLLKVIEEVKVKAEKSGFFQFLRSSYSTLEVSCLKNKGGRYLEIAEYHSGGQKGSIRIPEGSRATGWKKLTDEMWSFFLGREEKNRKQGNIPAGGAASKGNTAAVGNSGSSGTSRDSRALGKWVAPFTPTEDLKKTCTNSNLNSKSRVLMNPDAPRPTRFTNFTWNPASKTLRINKNEGEARKAQWVSLKYKAVGLAQQIMGPQAQPENLNLSDPGSVPLTTPQASTVEIEASRFRLESPIETPRSPLGASELEIVPPAALEVQVYNNSGNGMEDGEICGDLGSDEGDPRDMEAEEVRVDLAEQGMPLMVGSPSLSTSDEAMQVIEASGALNVGNMLSMMSYGETSECSSPLSCSPLAMMNPTEFSNSVAALDANVSASQEVISQWVKKHYRGFCKLVGFPLDTHEQQCMALLQSIEAERFKYKSSVKMKQPAVSVRKGTRELRNLASSINYDGRRIAC